MSGTFRYVRCSRVRRSTSGAVHTSSPCVLVHSPCIRVCPSQILHHHLYVPICHSQSIIVSKSSFFCHRPSVSCTQNIKSVCPYIRVPVLVCMSWSFCHSPYIRIHLVTVPLSQLACHHITICLYTICNSCTLEPENE